MNLTREQSLENVRALFPNKPYIVSIILLCQLNKTGFWREWRDFSGNRLKFEDKKAVIIPTKKLSPEAVIPDLYARSLKRKYQESEFIFIEDKSEEKLVWWKSKEKIRLTCFSNERITDREPLTGDLKSLRWVVEGKTKEDTLEMWSGPKQEIPEWLKERIDHA